MTTWRMGAASRRGAQTPGRLSARALLLLGATVVLLIAGLLGMHALGGSAGGHGGAHASVAEAGPVVSTSTDRQSHGAAAHDAHAAATLKAADCSRVCEADGPLVPGHAEVMACVLALLAGLLVLVPPGSLGRPWTAVLAAPASVDASAVLLAPPTPSLTLLSISRT